ncbi:MAG: cyclic-di-AMP receptor [Bacilli bacterium]
MKLILAIVSNDDASVLMKELVKEKFSVTKLASSGGLLRKGNTTLMIGSRDDDVDKVVDIITKFSKTRNELVPSSVISDIGIIPSTPLEVTVGGATIFIVDVEKFKKI